MSWVTSATFWIFNWSRMAARSRAWATFSYPASGCDDRPIPRRSGTITVWSLTRTAASGSHMSPVSPKPCSSSTAGPWPPTRTYCVPPVTGICCMLKLAGKGLTSATAGVVPASGRISAAAERTRPRATFRKERGMVRLFQLHDGTMPSSLPSYGVRRAQRHVLARISHVATRTDSTAGR